MRTSVSFSVLRHKGVLGHPGGRPCKRSWSTRTSLPHRPFSVCAINPFWGSKPQSQSHYVDWHEEKVKRGVTKKKAPVSPAPPAPTTPAPSIAKADGGAGAAATAATVSAAAAASPLPAHAGVHPPSAYGINYGEPNEFIQHIFASKAYMAADQVGDQAATAAEPSAAATAAAASTSTAAATATATKAATATKVAATTAAGATAASDPSGSGYHNYIVEGTQRLVQGVNGSASAVFGGGRPQDSAEQRAAQDLAAASHSLKQLVQEIKPEQGLFGQQQSTVASTLNHVASKLSDVAEKRTSFVGDADPVHSLISGIHDGLVANPGLRDVFLGIKRLGDSMVDALSSFADLPPATKVAAYMTAALGVLLLIRPPAPEPQSDKGKGNAAQGRGGSSRTPVLRQLDNKGQGSPQSKTVDAEWITARSPSPTPAQHTASSRPSAATPSPVPRTSAMESEDWWEVAPQQGQQLPPGARRPNGVQQAWQAFKGSLSLSSPPATTPSPSPAPASAQFTTTSANVAAAAVAAAADARIAEVQRAASVVQTNAERMREAADLKDRLRWVARALGPVLAVVPGGEAVRGEADALLLKLEALTPTDKPLNIKVDDGLGYKRSVNPLGPPAPTPDINLLGEWQLEYASNGPSSTALASPSSTASVSANLLAHALQLIGSIPGFGMDGVVQRLWVDPGRKGVILVENSATFSFGFLGSWKVTARGGWRDNGGGLCAQAWFESFGVRPDGHILGFNASSLPEVVLPVPAQFQTLTDWCTTYLDGDTRVSRGAGGLIFLFKKKAVPAGALPRGQSPITVYPWPSPTPPPTSPAPV